MRNLLMLIVLGAGVAGCGKSGGGGGGSSSSSSALRISGGTETKFGGLIFDIPSTWSTKSEDGKLGLVPAGANASGMLEELYVLVTDPNVKSIDGPEADQKVAELVGEGATKKSGPDSKKFGDVDGRVWVYSTPAQNDQTAEVRVYALKGGQVCGLIVLGLPNVLAKRDPDLNAILASLRAAPMAPAGAGGQPQELAGQWIWMTNVNANNGGSQTNTWIMLDAGGRYKWHYDSVSSNPNGAVWGSEDETGTWSATDSSLSLQPDRGNAYTYTLEKRNHPKNVGDPMIVLNGKAYVTATGRQPWR